MKTFELLLVIFAFIFCGVSFEKILNPKLTLEECACKFKSDFLKILSNALFSKERHIFDTSLRYEFQEILDDIYHHAFEPHFTVQFVCGCPCIIVTFVQSRELADTEIQTACELLKLKFSEYCSLRNLSFRHFVTYHKLSEKMYKITIFYEEFREDTEPFLKNYKIKIGEKTGANHGTMRDRNLEKEIRDRVRKL